MTKPARTDSAVAEPWVLCRGCGWLLTSCPLWTPNHPVVIAAMDLAFLVGRMLVGSTQDIARFEGTQGK
jgi:hypothetical protein